MLGNVSAYSNGTVSNLQNKPCIQFSAACHTRACQQAHMHTHASAQPDQGRSRRPPRCYLPHTYTHPDSHTMEDHQSMSRWGGFTRWQLFCSTAMHRETHTHTPTFTHRCIQKPTFVQWAHKSTGRHTHLKCKTYAALANTKNLSVHTHQLQIWGRLSQPDLGISWSFKIKMFDLTVFNTVPTVCVLFVIKCREASQWKAVWMLRSSRVLMCVCVGWLQTKREMLQIFTDEELLQCENLGIAENSWNVKYSRSDTLAKMHKWQICENQFDK